MEKYNKFIRNIIDLVEKGLFASKDLKREIEHLVKFNVENITGKLNLVSREEFDVQKRRIEKLEKKLNKIKRKW